MTDDNRGPADVKGSSNDPRKKSNTGMVEPLPHMDGLSTKCKGRAE